MTLVIGMLGGTGLLLLWRGMFPAPTRLPIVFARLARDGRSVADMGATRRHGLPFERVTRLVGGRLGRRVEADLAVVHRTAERFALEKVGASVAAAAICLAVVAPAVAIGSSIPVGSVVVAVTCAVAAGFVLPDVTLRRRAARRRAAFRSALSSYLDLVHVLLSGGAGVESALHGAAEAGDGWAFEEIRHALVHAHALRTSPWDAFATLGRALQIEELTEIAASLQLAGAQGARVRRSLAAKAAALRGRQMAAIEAEALSATERMGLPMVLMFVGFIALLAYPALQQIVHTL